MEFKQTTVQEILDMGEDMQMMPHMMGGGDMENMKDMMKHMPMMSATGTPTGIMISPEGRTQIKRAKTISGSSGMLSVTIFGLPISVATDASSTHFIGVTDVSGIATVDTHPHVRTYPLATKFAGS